MIWHDVRQDTAGWGRHTRLTCYSKQCYGATLVRQPFMDAARWETAKAWFLKQHPPEREIVPYEAGPPIYGAGECASRHVAERHAKQALRDMERDLGDEPSLDDDEPDFSDPIDGSPEDIDRRIDDALYPETTSPAITISGGAR